MSGTKILWGQIVLVFTVVLASLWGATQWAAWRLGYQAQLGNPWAELGGMPLYPPPALFWWWYWYDAYAPDLFLEAGMIAAAGGFAAIGIAIIMSVRAGARGEGSLDLRLGAMGDSARRSGRAACSDPTASCSAASRGVPAPRRT